jgi:hypothetical protein
MIPHCFFSKTKLHGIGHDCIDLMGEGNSADFILSQEGFA